MGHFSHLGDVDGLNVIALPITRSDPADANKDGMQEAHLTGAKLYNEDLKDLRAEIDPFRIGTSEMPSNGVLAPASRRVRDSTHHPPSPHARHFKPGPATTPPTMVREITHPTGRHHPYRPSRISRWTDENVQSSGLSANPCLTGFHQQYRIWAARSASSRR